MPNKLKEVCVYCGQGKRKGNGCENHFVKFCGLDEFSEIYFWERFALEEYQQLDKDYHPNKFPCRSCTCHPPHPARYQIDVYPLILEYWIASFNWQCQVCQASGCNQCLIENTDCNNISAYLHLECLDEYPVVMT